jgi:hypothetical protein
MQARSQFAAALAVPVNALNVSIAPNARPDTLFPLVTLFM